MDSCLQSFLSVRWCQRYCRSSHGAHFGECAGHLSPNCSRTDECKGQLAANFLSPPCFDRGHFFSSLERTQYFAPDDVGIIERFEALVRSVGIRRAQNSCTECQSRDKEVAQQLTSSQMDNALVW